MKTLVIALLCWSSLSWAQMVPFIVGGSPAAKNELPFQVSVQTSSGSHFCGGSLIAPDTVLTAAHCVENKALTRVVAGITSLKEKGEKFTVKKVIIHPLRGKTENGNDYDFAILKLDGASKLQPIALSEQVLDCGEATTSGWGTTREGAANVSTILMKVDVPIVPQEVCADAYSELTDTMICAGLPEGGKDSCQGDSGGPLFVRGVGGKPFLVGVVSWGEGCARPKKYGVYARVSSAYQWILENTK